MNSHSCDLSSKIVFMFLVGRKPCDYISQRMIYHQQLLTLFLADGLLHFMLQDILLLTKDKAFFLPKLKNSYLISFIFYFQPHPKLHGPFAASRNHTDTSRRFFAYCNSANHSRAWKFLQNYLVQLNWLRTVTSRQIDNCFTSTNLYSCLESRKNCWL